MLLVIYNTSAGNGDVENLIKVLCDDLIHLGIPFTSIKISQFSNVVAEELLQNCHIKRVIICGGDGTVNHAINKMDGYLNQIEIGILPCGYGNLIAGSLTATSSLDSFVSDRAKTNFNEVRIGQANNQYFLNVASIGLTADTVSLVEKFRQTVVGSAFYRAVGGLIIHILFFCIALLMNKTFTRYNNYPSSRAWLRSFDARSEHTFLELSDLQDLISQYKSLYLSGDRSISWNNNRSTVSSKGVYIEYNNPFSWQIDGEPQKKTRSLKIDLNCQKLKILTINQDGS